MKIKFRVQKKENEVSTLIGVMDVDSSVKLAVMLERYHGYLIELKLIPKEAVADFSFLDEKNEPLAINDELIEMKNEHSFQNKDIGEINRVTKDCVPYGMEIKKKGKRKSVLLPIKNDVDAVKMAELFMKLNQFYNESEVAEKEVDFNAQDFELFMLDKEGRKQDKWTKEIDDFDTITFTKVLEVMKDKEKFEVDFERFYGICLRIIDKEYNEKNAGTEGIIRSMHSFISDYVSHKIKVNDLSFIEEIEDDQGLKCILIDDVYHDGSIINYVMKAIYEKGCEAMMIEPSAIEDEHEENSWYYEAQKIGDVACEVVKCKGVYQCIEKEPSYLNHIICHGCGHDIEDLLKISILKSLLDDSEVYDYDGDEIAEIIGLNAS